MKLSLSQTSYELRDAGEVAFGILVFAILLAVGSFLAGILLSAMLPAFSPQHGLPGLQVIATSAIIWVISMVFVLRHYKRATRPWVQERRGGHMLLLVECITTVLSVAASLLLSGPSNGVLQATKICLAAFVFLLVCSHVAAYALLRYRPRLKELSIWSALGAAIIIEIFKDT